MTQPFCFIQKSFTSIWLKCKNPQQPDTLARIFCSWKDQFISKRFYHSFCTIGCSKIIIENQIFSEKEGFWLILLCVQPFCLSFLRNIEIFLHISDNTCFLLLMHYFLSNAFNYSTAQHLPLAPLWQKIMIFYTAYLGPYIFVLCVSMFLLGGRGLGCREAGS